MRAPVLVLGAWVALVAGAAAQACSEGCGGAAFEWEQPYYKPGEIARGTTSVYVPRRGPGGVDDGPYTVYLRPLDRATRKPPVSDPAAIPVGTIAIDPQGRGTAAVAIEFTVPDVPGGTYLVEHCSPGCRSNLGELSGSTLEIVSSAFEERALIASRIDDLEWQLMRAEARIYRLKFGTRRQLRDAEKEGLDELRDAQAQIEREIGARVRAMERKLEMSRAEPETGGLSGMGMAAIAAVGLLVAVGFRLRVVPSSLVVLPHDLDG